MKTRTIVTLSLLFVVMVGCSARPPVRAEAVTAAQTAPTSSNSFPEYTPDEIRVPDPVVLVSFEQQADEDPASVWDRHRSLHEINEQNNARPDNQTPEGCKKNGGTPIDVPNWNNTNTPGEFESCMMPSHN